MKQNAFGQEILEFRELLADPKLAKVIGDTLDDIFHHLELKEPKKAVSDVLALARSEQTEIYEADAHKVLLEHGLAYTLTKKRANRSSLVYGQIKLYLSGKRILDLGCGDGNIGSLVCKTGKNVTLADIYLHPNIEKLGLPFAPLKPEGRLPFRDGQFDCIIVSAVLHHSDNPQQLLKETYRVTKGKGRVIVIETVYGLPSADFKNLNEEQQRRFTIFFDHFSNRVVQYKSDPQQRINCPFNFQTPEHWKDTFEQVGFLEEKIEHLGFDQPAVKEYHTLHVLRPSK